MRKTGKLIVICVVGAALAAPGPVAAHRADMMGPNKAGPIKRGRTTMGEMRNWFGAPSSRSIVRVGCQRVIKARWDNDLKVFATRGENRIVEAIFVRTRQLVSAEHGELDIHTRKELRVGNRERKLRRLHPRSEPMTHRGHTHYRLRTSRSGTYLMAKVVDGRIVQLESWPFEFC